MMSNSKEPILVVDLCSYREQLLLKLDGLMKDCSVGSVVLLNDLPSSNDGLVFNLTTGDCLENFQMTIDSFLPKIISKDRQKEWKNNLRLTNQRHRNMSKK